MQEALHHRGPDDRAVWIDPHAGIGFAHTRLAVIDLTTAGRQPMADPSGRFHITFNGEIYNFQALRRELEERGEVFHSRSDTEVLLRLFAREGRSMLGRLHGMFAFAIWDAQERSLFLARDPFGIKPLYYAELPGGLVFASELRALRRCSLVPDALEPRALQAYFETGSVPEPLTLLKDALLLPAGHWALWKNGGFCCESYWEPRFEPSPDFAGEAAARTRAALLESMQAHFVSDTPVGVFLSGGIDSTALVALAREVGHGNLDTFSIGVDDPALDESGMARCTAEHFGTRHHEMRLDATAAKNLFDGFIRSVDQPSVDGINTYTVSAFARSHGMKVVLSGLGGDELFGGYPSFQKVPRLARLATLSRSSTALSSFAGRCLERCAPDHRLRRVGTLLQRPPTIPNAFRAFRGIFSGHHARCLAAEFSGLEEKKLPAFPFSNGSTLEGVDAVSHCELTLYMRNQLLRDSDVMSMAHGLELRVPYVDTRLFATLSRIPAAIRVQPGKRLLLDAVPELPPWVVGHRKLGFVFPFKQWLEEKWTETFQSTNQRMHLRNPSWFQQWSVFMLENWLGSK